MLLSPPGSSALLCSALLCAAVIWGVRVCLCLPAVGRAAHAVCVRVPSCAWSRSEKACCSRPATWEQNDRQHQRACNHLYGAYQPHGADCTGLGSRWVCMRPPGLRQPLAHKYARMRLIVVSFKCVSCGPCPWQAHPWIPARLSSWARCCRASSSTKCPTQCIGACAHTIRLQGPCPQAGTCAAQCRAWQLRGWPGPGRATSGRHSRSALHHTSWAAQSRRAAQTLFEPHAPASLYASC